MRSPPLHVALPRYPMDMTPARKPARRPAWLVFLAAALLGGCVSTAIPELGVPLPALWKNAPPTQRALPPDLRGWWHIFNDPQLDSLVEQALADNPGIQQATARLHAARTLHQRVGAEFLPNLHARTADVIDPDASAAFFVAGFDATWELGLFGRRSATERTARSVLDTAVADDRDARVTLVAEVVRNWVELRVAQQRGALLEQIHLARQRQLQLIATRVDLRLASSKQLAQARAVVAESEAALSSPQQDGIAAAQSLAALLGRPEPDPDWSRVGPTPETGDWQLSTVPADLLRTRPDIARSEAAVLRAAGELGLARADLYPSIGLGGSIHWAMATNSNRKIGADEAIAGFGPVIDIPLFDWGLRKARANAKSDELQAAVFAYRKTVLTGVAEVETALGTVEQQRRREASSARAWQALTEAAEATSARQKLGLASVMDIMDSNAERDLAALELTAARSSHGLAYVALYKALGGPAALDPEITRTDPRARAAP